ncbi:MAG: FUSC family protein [Flavobacteriaceae bacterium]|nr:FUSC family protein [Flavobacteriaceae bacterium]
MRNAFLILGLLASAIALIFSLTSWFAYTYIPAVFALIAGLISFYISRQHQYPKKPVQLIFIIAIIAISVAIYKVYTLEVGVESPASSEITQ